MNPTQSLIEKTLELAEKATPDEMGMISQAASWIEKNPDPNKVWVGETYLEVQQKLAELRTAAPKLALGLKRALEVLTDVQDMVNEQDCRGDEDCDHCVIVHHTLDPAMSEIHAICSEEGK
jgi:hypothetical protein